MRKLLIASLTLIVVVIGGAALAPRFLDVNRYHDRIQSELQQRLGRPVQFGQMGLSLLPPTFNVQNAVVSEDPSFGTERPFAQASALDVRIKLLPLLSGKLDVQSLNLHTPQVEVVRNQQGVWNFASIGKQQSQPTPKAGQQRTNFELGSLIISDGTLAVTDNQKHQSRSVYDHIDLTLKDFAPTRPFTVALAAHLPGAGKQVARLDSKVGPFNEQSMLNTPIDGDLKLEQVSLSAVQKFLNSQALAETDATLSGQAHIKNEIGKLASSGQLRLENPVIRGVQVGYPITLDYDAVDDLSSDVIQLSKGNIKLGSTPIAISGSVNTSNTPAVADLKANTSNVSIAEIGRLASAFGVALSPGIDLAGHFNADVRVQGPLTSPVLNGTVTGSDLVASGKAIPTLVKVQSIELHLTPTQIQSNQFTASAGGTSVEAQFTLQQYTASQPNADATLRTSNANIGELLSIAQATGVSGTESMTGSGTLSLNLHAVGPVKNASAMQFQGNGQIANAEVKSPQMTQPLQVRGAQIQFTQNSMVLKNLDAQAASMHATGNMTLQNFSEPQVQFALTADKVNALELEKMFGQQPANSAQPNSQQPQRSSMDLNLVTRAHAQVRPSQQQPAKTTAEPSLIQKITGRGTINVGEVTYQNLVLQKVRSTIALNHGVVRLDPMNASLYGGQASGNATLDMRRATTLYNVNLKTQKVDTNKLLSSVSSVKDTLYGLLASSIQAQFASTQGGGSEDLARTLNGHVSMNVSEGKLANVDILQQLSSIGKFQSRSRTANFTPMKQLSGDLNIQNGVANTNNLKALIEGGTLAAAGDANLVDQSLNMHVTAVLSKDYSQQVGGNSIGGFAQTALANKNGELVLPVIVTGSFQKMQFAPDLQMLAQMKLHNLLPSFSNPGQLTQGLLGSLSNKKGQSAGDNPIGSVLGAFGGNGSKQQNSGQQQPGSMSGDQGKNQQQPQKENSVGDVLNGLLGGKKSK